MGTPTPHPPPTHTHEHSDYTKFNLRSFETWWTKTAAQTENTAGHVRFCICGRFYSVNIHTKVLFCFKLEPVRAQTCWLTLYQQRTNGKMLACHPVQYFCHTSWHCSWHCLAQHKIAALMVAFSCRHCSWHCPLIQTAWHKMSALMVVFPCRYWS